MDNSSEAHEKFIHQMTDWFKMEIVEDKQKRKPTKTKPGEWETTGWWEYKYDGERYGRRVTFRSEEKKDEIRDPEERKSYAISMLLSQAYRTLLELQN